MIMKRYSLHKPIAALYAGAAIGASALFYQAHQEAELKSNRESIFNEIQALHMPVINADVFRDTHAKAMASMNASPKESKLAAYESVMDYYDDSKFREFSQQYPKTRMPYFDSSTKGICLHLKELETIAQEYLSVADPEEVTRLIPHAETFRASAYDDSSAEKALCSEFAP